MLAGFAIDGEPHVEAGGIADEAQFGTYVGKAYAANPTGAVEAGYVNAINSITDGGGCPPYANGDFNGCGCHVALTYGGSNASGTQATFNENWTQLNTDKASQSGTQSWYWNMVCNYPDSVAGDYPWYGGDHT